MKVTEFRGDGFRNLKQVVLQPGDGINIIYGQNAQGKTNLIEAIWLFSGARSFRSAKESKLIGFDCQRAELSLEFDDTQRIQKANMVFGAKNKYFLNRVELKSPTEYAGNFLCVVFSPAHLSIIQGSPSLRRKFLDSAICQIRPDYHHYLHQYEKVLYQRNSLLKELYRQPYLKDTIEVWDLQLAKLGTIVSLLRQDYTDKVAKFSHHIYQGISSQKENLQVEYQSTVFDKLEDREYTQDKVKHYLKQLENNLEQDIKQGFTGIGAHRDEVELLINNVSVKNYGSQGQQRSSILALKLAEAKLLKSITGNNPVILLDDVMSELDVSRQDYILNHVKGHQVFITCCDISNTLRLQHGEIFHVEDGRIQS